MYTVTYVTDEGTFSVDSAHEDVPYVVIGDVPASDDRVFVCWTHGDEHCGPGDEIAVTGDVVLTAEWRERLTYMVTYEAEGETFLVETATEGVPYDITRSVPESELGIFVCWEHDGTELAYGDSVVADGDMVLHAKWRDRAEYTVTYMADGSVVLTDTAYEGLNYVVGDIVPERDGAEFSHWTLDGQRLYAGDIVTIEGDATIVAQWTDPRSFEITYVVDGEVFLRETAVSGGAFTVTDRVPSDDDRVFDRWVDGSGASYAAGDRIDASGDVTLTAQWRERAEYTVRYVVDGSTVLTDTAREGIPYTVRGIVPESRDSIFTHWLAGGRGLGPGDTVVLTGNTVLEAQWRERLGLEVSYISDGTVIATDAATEGLGYTIRDTAPVSGDRVFVGWRAAGLSGTLGPGDTVVLTRDTVLEAVWRDAEEFTVTYVSEGSVVMTDTAIEGVTYVVRGLDDGPMVFVGWLAEDGSTLGEGDRISVTGDVTLTAQWRDRGVHTVTYVSDGEAFATDTAIEGVPYAIAEDVPANDRMVLVGWSLDGTVLTAGDLVPVDRDIVLEAVWRERAEFTVTFVTDDGVFLEATALEGVPFVIDTGVPASEGLTFVGWETDGHEVLADGDSILVTGDTVLTAVWEPPVEVSVTYVYVDGTVLHDVALAGQPYRVQDWTPADGEMVFVGWRIGGEGDVLVAGDTVVLDGDATLLPAWRERQVYQVTYLVDGETFMTAEASEGVPYATERWIPVSDDGIFVGWGLDGRTLSPGDEVVLEGDDVLDAVWRDRQEYRVTFLADGRTFATATTTEGVPFEIVPGIPESEAGIFVGWTTDGIDGLFNEGDALLLDGRTTFEASWRDRAEYTVTYTAGGETFLTATAYEGLEHAVTSSVPTDDLLVFTGWSLDGNTLSSGDRILVDGDVTLTAEWREKTEFTLRFVVDGETLGTVMTVLEGDTVTIDVTAESPGRVLEGWSDGRGVYAVGSAYTVTSDTVLQAVWSEAADGGEDGEYAGTWWPWVPEDRPSVTPQPPSGGSGEGAGEPSGGTDEEPEDPSGGEPGDDGAEGSRDGRGGVIVPAAIAAAVAAVLVCILLVVARRS